MGPSHSCFTLVGQQDFLGFSPPCFKLGNWGSADRAEGALHVSSYGPIHLANRNDAAGGGEKRVTAGITALPKTS